MSVINRIAHYQNRRDEVPNQELARDLAARKDKAGIHEIVEHLWDKNIDVANDCTKVLYEIGYVDPHLVAPYVGEFINLLKSKQNRLVWGGMLALGVLAELCPDEIFEHLDEIKKAMESGSVITKDNGVKVLAGTASSKPDYNKTIFPYLLDHLAACRPKDVPQHSEKTLPAVNKANKADFVKVLEKRMEDLSDPGLARVKKVVKQAQSIT